MAPGNIGQSPSALSAPGLIQDTKKPRGRRPSYLNRRSSDDDVHQRSLTALDVPESPGSKMDRLSAKKSLSEHHHHHHRNVSSHGSPIDIGASAESLVDSLAQLGFHGATQFVINNAPERIAAALEVVTATIKAGKVKISNPAGLLRWMVSTAGPIVAPATDQGKDKYTSGKYGRFVRS